MSVLLCQSMPSLVCLCPSISSLVSLSPACYPYRKLVVPISSLLSYSPFVPMPSLLSQSSAYCPSMSAVSCPTYCPSVQYISSVLSAHLTYLNAATSWWGTESWYLLHLPRHPRDSIQWECFGWLHLKLNEGTGDDPRKTDDLRRRITYAYGISSYYGIRSDIQSMLALEENRYKAKGSR